MKTLINKTNPQIRITAPEIESYRDFYTLQDKDFHYLFKMEDWTLVEEEPEKQTSEYFKKPNYDKQVVKKMSEELAKIITDQIAEPVDIEKILELLEKHLELFTAGNLDRRKGYTKHDMQDAFILGFKAGIKRR